jgi:hypothetical protein
MRMQRATRWSMRKCQHPREKSVSAQLVGITKSLLSLLCMMKFEVKYAQHPCMMELEGKYVQRAVDVFNDAFVLFEIIRVPHVCPLHV